MCAPELHCGTIDGMTTTTASDALQSCVVLSQTGTGPTIGQVTDAAGVDTAALLGAMNIILSARHPDVALTAIFDCGLGQWFMPEVGALDLDQGGRKLHKDNLAHSFTVVAQSANRPRVRWAALCHDLGKPPTRVIHDNGTVTFYNHETVGSRITTKMLRRLGCDEAFTADVAVLVEISGRLHDFDEGNWTDAALRRFAVDAGELVNDALAVARADCTSARPGRRAQVVAQVNDVAERLAAVKAADEHKLIRPVLNGDQIIAALGIEPGPQVGPAYKYLLSFAQSGVTLTEDEAYVLLAEWANDTAR